jgi:hypothetical protein
MESSNSKGLQRIPSSGMWRCVGLIKTDFSEERVTSIFRVEEITQERKVLDGW